jgi:hypothetical protein
MMEFYRNLAGVYLGVHVVFLADWQNREVVHQRVAQTLRHKKFLSLLKKEQEMKTLPKIPLVIISHSS